MYFKFYKNVNQYNNGALLLNDSNFSVDIK